VSGTAAAPEGITNPPIDDLLEAADGSKYGLVIYAAKRARQINAYYSQLGEGLLEYVGPLVETHVQEKPLSVALREIDAGLLTVSPASPDDATDATPTGSARLDATPLFDGTSSDDSATGESADSL
jgi:DNA-directed RNA polymerase subunit omega